MSRFHWACFTKPTFSRLEKDFGHLSWTRLWLEPLPGWLTLGLEPWSTLKSPAYAGFRYAGITMFVLPICWSRAWGALKSQRERELKPQWWQFTSREGSESSLLPAAPAGSSQHGRSDLGQEAEPELFDRSRVLHHRCEECSWQGRGGSPACRASLHTAALLNVPCEGLAATKFSWTTVYYSISYVLTRKHFLQYIACSLTTGSRRFLTGTLWL